MGKKIKNLANCTPREFLRQTNKIRKAVSKWLTLTKIMEIRKRLPELPEGLNEEERQARLVDQIQENANAMLDMILDEHPDETAELLGLLCFIEPEDLDQHSVAEMLGAFTELMNSREVIDFFISLGRLASVNTSSAASR